MRKKAILATDLSIASDLLIQCSDAYREMGIEEITLFHALGVEYMNFYGYVSLDSTKKRLEELRDILTKKGFKTDIVIKEGLPHFELEGYSQDKDDSIIISGTKGKGFLKGLVLGSTVSHLMKTTKIPLLVVQCNEKATKNLEFVPELQCHVSNGCVLFPTDFSDFADKAFHLMLDNVSPFAKVIHLLHIQDEQIMKYRKQVEVEEFNTRDLKRLEEMKQNTLSRCNAEVITELRSGNPAGEILKAIEENNCSLVVMGKQGRGFIRDHIIGSVTRKVIEESGINCLVVPFPGKK